ncbi:MAG: hypothetical protein KGN79_09545 [Acidobacteriota bacterium]|nr:hypothetical protein [Acidobacteriota bacterium]
MIRPFAVCLGIFASALASLIVVSIYVAPHGWFSFNPSNLKDAWFWGVGVSVSLLILAFGLVLGRNGESGLSWPWPVIIIGVSATQLFDLREYSSSTEWVQYVEVLFLVLLQLVVTAFFFIPAERQLRVLRSTTSRGVLIAVSAIGGVMVLASCVAHATFSSIEDMNTSVPGWHILTGKSPWVTGIYNVAVTEDGLNFPWFHALYTPWSYLNYLLALISSLALLVLLVVYRGSIRSIASLKHFPILAVVLCFSMFWSYTDIFWGWHFELGPIKWMAALGTALWACSQIIAFVLLIPIARGIHDVRMQTLLLLMLPFAIFNVFLFPAYGLFIRDTLDLPGLAVFLLGLQLECWVCLAMVLIGLPERTLKTQQVAEFSAPTQLKA